MDHLNIVEASIDDIQAALSSGALTSVELAATYLHRISRYDCRGLSLNSIPVLNSSVFAEAVESDDRRASGGTVGRLEGIPYTVKDSYKVKGMSVASGSPAFKDLIANEDAFTVAAIRSEGGVLIGRTNMPPMAYGGMQRGVYGRAESPYNPNYLAAAWSSGSSNGSAVSTAASMAAFGMGEETVSSGRSPASNNALVAYTPSRGWISIRGNWPLYPTCDVVVPHTRTMDDMLKVLEVITAEDPSTNGDFWRDQPFVDLTSPWKGSSRSEIFSKIATSTSLAGVRIAVPSMYIGGTAPENSTPVFTSEGVQELWRAARGELEALGAEVVEVPDFPAVTAYENPDLLPEGVTRLPDNWSWYERGPLVAHGWEGFLRSNADPNFPGLSAVDEFEIFPHSMRTEAELAHLPPANAIHWGKLAQYARESTIYETQHLGSALEALENLRKRLVDGYLEQYQCDLFVFPSQGDVAAEDSDVNPDSAAHAWKNGVFYSNGNRALRHLGIPSVTVPMGSLRDKKMPVGLTFAGRAYEDERLLGWANAFEKKTRLRNAPAHTPELPSDLVELRVPVAGEARAKRPFLDVKSCVGLPSSDRGPFRVEMEGLVTMDASRGSGIGSGEPTLKITVNAEEVPREQIICTQVSGGDDTEGVYHFEAWAHTSGPPERSEREKTRVPVARDKSIVVILARAAPGGYPAGFLALV
ncbi:related to glu/asp-tRNA amidotransferase subunit A [Cephalotrichum gorgonifer]|uniref:Related to glu/asp-tRNA amidotransferase subunit A n=1 Tax=Cephalotrichum gorgonifer TaxID=2041049 RepID=A0AAE8MW51_9PEZI|nr:related to glu/asp-tRNA amidotransferase subunit A [Cephalotrichum gorgonifer]